MHLVNLFARTSDSVDTIQRKVLIHLAPDTGPQQCGKPSLEALLTTCPDLDPRSQPNAPQ